jgi:phosphohistidine phosphatase
MKSLSLFRHAKTERHSASGRDFDRALTERGQGDAERVGEEMRRQGLQFDLILASPAQRSVETVKGAGMSSPEYDERIYDASTSQLLKIVHAVDDGVDRLMMVGHNPGFERLASRLICDDIEMPTCSVIEIELAVERWRDVENGSGRQVRFIQPKKLD